MMFCSTVSCRLSGFADSDFAPVLQTLVEAYKEKEEESFYRCCDDSVFRTMDNEVHNKALTCLYHRYSC